MVWCVGVSCLLCVVLLCSVVVWVGVMLCRVVVLVCVCCVLFDVCQCCF